MKSLADSRLLAKLAPAQGGVFSTVDLKMALAEIHPAAFGRRIHSLMDEQVLFRFTRGFYIVEEFDLAILSQRIAPQSVVSFETVLAHKLIIGTNPRQRIVATKVGPTRSYSARGFEVEHVSLSKHLSFGWSTADGVRYACAEKAVLDLLYFHLRGRRCVFDIYSDLNLRKLDMELIHEYLMHYRNPKFVVFAKRVLEI